MDPKLWWFLTRASGLTAWVLLAAAVLWGLALAGRPLRRPSPGWLLDVHRFLGAAALCFTGVHMLTLVLDEFVHFGPRELLVPFASAYRPAAVAWGVVALYLLVAVQVTSWLRRHLPHRLWRGTHWLTYPLLGLATWHGFAAGTDAGNRAVLYGALLAGVAVVFLAVYRALPVRAGVGVGVRAPAAGGPAGGPVAADLTLLVRQTRWEADQIMSLDLVRVDGAPLPAWEPGAHVELLLPSGQIRQYSLCGDPADRSAYRVAVLRTQEGRGGSREVHERLRAGQAVALRGPRQRFPLVDAPAYVFVAGGIGITAMLPMARQVAATGTPWRLYYTGRHRAGMAFVDEAVALAPDRVSIVVTERDGRLDVAGLLRDAPPGAAVYCCGPEALIGALEEAMPDTGQLHVERFAAPANVSAVGEPGQPFEVELRRSGKVLTVPADRSVLDVVREVVPSVASSCGEGFCGTCEVRVLAGAPEHRDDVLSAEERERGDTMMICVSRAATPHLTLDL